MSDLLLRIGTKLILPFILLFALYVQFHGEYGPGGGFQAGVIAAAAVAGSAGAASRSSSPTLSVQARRVSGSIPASIGRRYSSMPAATRYGRQAENCART